MATNWQIRGSYFETCSCDYLCPCISSHMTAQPTRGHCDFAMVYHIDQGRYGNVTLDGINFAIVGHTSSVMC